MMSLLDVFIHESSYVDDGALIGKGSKVWHFSHIMTGALIGKNCNLGQNVFVAQGVELGDNCKVQNNVSIYEGVKCEEDVFLGPSMVFTNVVNPRSEVNRKSEYKKTLIRKGATIGANATIICGVEIGSYAFVAAGAVITRSVKPHALMAGVPAKQIAWMSAKGATLKFEGSIAFCPIDGQKYKILNKELVKVD